MAVKMLNVPSLPNIPWQEKPADYKLSSPVWRYSENPVMGRNPTPEDVARIFNSAVVPWEDRLHCRVCAASRSTASPTSISDTARTASTGTSSKDKIPFVNEKGEPIHAGATPTTPVW